jgi:hypothetical protein
MKRLLLLIPVIAIVGCGLFGGEDFYPLAVDNEWKYDGTMTTGTDTVAMTMTIEQKITGKDTINTEDVFVMSTTITQKMFTNPPDTTLYVDTTMTRVSYIRETDDTIFSYKTDSTGSVPTVSLLLPLEEGKTWTNIEGNDTTIYTVKPQEDVTIADETYKNCWKIEITGNLMNMSGTHYHWYSDGTGLIKRAHTDTTGTFVLELIESTIK